MLIKEYRIPMPMSVEEYRIAQLYMIQVSNSFFCIKKNPNPEHTSCNANAIEKKKMSVNAAFYYVALRVQVVSSCA